MNNWIRLFSLFSLVILSYTAHSQDLRSLLNDPKFFQICPREDSNDTNRYALCATAPCFFLNDVAYCKCDIEHGKSISTPFNYIESPHLKRQNICDLLNDGVDNGFTVSTYSLPVTLTKEYADDYNHHGPAPMALYTCPSNATGEYAQCDGGICFDSTSGQEFPFIGKVKKNQIVCSCPTVEATGEAGFQIAGPWAKKDGKPCNGNDKSKECCDPDWFEQYCFPSGTPDGSYPTTGTSLYVGSPIGSGLLLSIILNGPPAPEINRCLML